MENFYSQHLAWCRWGRTLIFSGALPAHGRDSLFVVRAGFREELMCPQALHLLWTGLEPNLSGKCSAVWHWLKNTQINFLWEKKWDPFFFSFKIGWRHWFHCWTRAERVRGVHGTKRKNTGKNVISYPPPHNSEERSMSLGLTQPFYLTQWVTLKTRSHHESL